MENQVELKKCFELKKSMKTNMFLGYFYKIRGDIYLTNFPTQTKYHGP